MNIFLGKLVFALLSPIGTTICVGAAALALSVLRFRRASQALLILALAGLWTASSPVFANWLCYHVESRYPPRPPQDYPDADVVIVLGGILAQPLPPRIEPDVGATADRILFAWRLYRAGKAPQILISGGNLPWTTAAASEARLIADLLVELGVPRSALVLEESSRNTRENAQQTAAIFSARHWRSGLIVTSGLHMSRAVGVFRKMDVNVIPAATDIRGHLPLADSLLDFLPDADALGLTTSVAKEVIGSLVYRARGWM